MCWFVSYNHNPFVSSPSSAWPQIVFSPCTAATIWTHSPLSELSPSWHASPISHAGAGEDCPGRQPPHYNPCIRHAQGRGPRPDLQRQDYRGGGVERSRDDQQVLLRLAVLPFPPNRVRRTGRLQHALPSQSLHRCPQSDRGADAQFHRWCGSGGMAPGLLWIGSAHLRYLSGAHLPRLQYSRSCGRWLWGSVAVGCSHGCRGHRGGECDQEGGMGRCVRCI